ncbi:MAG: FAD-dependent pyridine nucleotide-disulfide oxidoreductase [Parcubacteria group bacterium GW2011_GWA2_47_10]|nr:MAG: FAD-dependent pyridine nucleotide-disulfide oxidoreductase [Parcubacteria group bacterium GW2011_GWA2_47_10]
MNYKYIIVGGGIAGTTAAEAIRTADKTGSLAIISDEQYRLYSRIMLSKPNFFLEKIPFENVWLKKEEWYSANNVAFMPGKKAVALDTSVRTITLDDGNVLTYEKLLLAPGGAARKFPGPGGDKGGIFVIRSLDDAKGIIAKTKTAKKAIVIGGGFVSFEMCEMLRMAGVDVTLLLREKIFWEILLDETSGQIIEDALIKGGVKILREAEVAEFLGDASITGAKLKDGTLLECDMAIVGIGIVMNLDWIKSAGIETNRGIIANEYLETSAKDVWVAGDTAEFNDLILGERVQLGNWVNAQMQGRTAGNAMTGKHEAFRLVSFYTTQGFETAIAFAGDVRVDKERVVITRGSHELKSYSRLITWNGRIIGATLINRTQDLAPISKLIEKGVIITGKEEQIKNPAFNLSELLK